MDALDLARWQFAITTVYHFFFVPITLGLSWLVAGMQTAWVRTGNEKWLRTTRIRGETVDEVPACGVRLRVVSVAAR